VAAALLREERAEFVADEPAARSNENPAALRELADLVHVGPGHHTHVTLVRALDAALEDGSVMSTLWGIVFRSCVANRIAETRTEQSVKLG
jgi:hypothetical protein